MAYLSDSDLSIDVLAAQFSSLFSTYHTRFDNHLNEIAEGEQVETSDISVDDDGYLSSKFLRRYGAYWVWAELFFNKSGANNVSLSDQEKYMIKYDACNKKVEMMENRITAEMLQDSINSRMSTSKSHNLYRS